MNFGNNSNNNINNELARYALSPKEELMHKHQKELDMLRAMNASPVTLEHVRNMQMKEIERLRSPLPVEQSPEERPVWKSWRNLTRDELLNRHREEMKDARKGSPAFVESTKAEHAEQLREWNALHRPNMANNANEANNNADNEEAFGELTPLHNNGLREWNASGRPNNANNAANEEAFGTLGPLRGLRKPAMTRPRRRTMKQRKTRRGKSRRYSRR